MKGVRFALALLAVLGGVALCGQTTNPAVAEAAYQAGLAKQSEAELTVEPAAAAALYREAITAYDAAIAAQPDHCLARLQAAISTTQLGVLSADGATRNEHLVAAASRFAAAAECPGADYLVFDQWATMLDSFIYALVSDDAQRRVVLAKIAEVCQRGLALAPDAAGRAGLEHRLGQVRLRQAALAVDPAEQAARRSEADRHLRAASQVLAAQRLFEDALVQQGLAEAAGSAAEACERYQAAIVGYDAAAAADPGHCAARLNGAVCRAQLGELAADRAARLAWLAKARAAFAAAADCPGVDPLVFEQWAILLRTHLYNAAAEPAARLALLAETVRVGERGLQARPPPTLAAQLERQVGTALMWSANDTPEPDQQRALLGRAVTHLRAAAAAVTAREALYHENDLGRALLSLGSLASDPAVLREAVAEFEAALRRDSSRADTHYNLAAAWSLLGDAEKAATYLATAIDRDPDDRFHQMAEVDPDLAPVRGTAGYAAALDRRRRQMIQARAAALHREAVALQQRAARAKDVAVVRGLLLQAAQISEQAAGLSPDHLAAQTLLAEVFAELARRGGADPEQRRRWLAAARDRFAAAARCPGADAPLYDQWSAFLLEVCLPGATNAADRAALLDDARRQLEVGAGLARFSSLRGRLATRRGVCLVGLAEFGTDTASLYAEAVRQFQAAEATGALERPAESYEFWGLALVRLGRAGKDQLLIRQGIERLNRSVELDPGRPSPHRQLGRGYAQLRQADLAIRHLRRYLELETDESLRRELATDPEFVSLRSHPEFRHLLAAGPAPARPRPRTVSDD